MTRQVLEEAKKAGVKAVWLQPGSFDEEGMRFAKENFESAVGGYDDGTIGGEGWCVLVDGEDAMDKAGRKWEAAKAIIGAVFFGEILPSRLMHEVAESLTFLHANDYLLIQSTCPSAVWPR